mgnify:CR=1 FL=1
MRLIDADAFKTQIAGITIANNYPTSKANAICKVIDAQPTVYDPDKVVEQLEELRKECEDPLQEYDPNYFIDKAIEIVKGGGVE